MMHDALKVAPGSMDNFPTITSPEILAIVLTVKIFSTFKFPENSPSMSALYASTSPFTKASAAIITLPFVFKEFLMSGQITSDQELFLKPLIEKVIEHENLKMYYNSNLKSYNEHDILAKSGSIIRPDKLVVFPNNEVVILDYKTGQHNTKNIKQLNDYMEVIEEMNLKMFKKILVYINDEIEVKEV